jgi:hypothetical protein
MGMEKALVDLICNIVNKRSQGQREREREKER